MNTYSTLASTRATLERDRRMVDQDSTDAELREYLTALEPAAQLDVLRLAFTYADLEQANSDLLQNPLSEEAYAQLDEVTGMVAGTIVEVTGTVVTVEIEGATPGSIAIDYRPGNAVSITAGALDVSAIARML